MTTIAGEWRKDFHRDLDYVGKVFWYKTGRFSASKVRVLAVRGRGVTLTFVVEFLDKAPSQPDAKDVNPVLGGGVPVSARKCEPVPITCRKCGVGLVPVPEDEQGEGLLRSGAWAAVDDNSTECTETIGDHDPKENA